MGRHALISRRHRQSWLERNIVSRRPLIVRIARHHRMARAFGLTGLAKPAAGMPSGVIVVPEEGFDRAQRMTLFPGDPAFRPPFMEQAEEGGYEVSPAPGEHEEHPDQQVASVSQFVEGADQESVSAALSPEPGEIEPLEKHSRESPQEPQITERVESGAPEPKTVLIHHENADQLHNIEEPVEAQSQLERADSHAQPTVRRDEQRKRSRGRIQEQPVEARHMQPAPVPPSRASMKNQGVPKRADTQVGEAGREAIAADDLFAARDTDLSPQAWLARLMGRKSAARDKEDAQMQAGDSEQPESKPQVAVSGQSAKNEAFASAVKGSKAMKPQAGRTRSQEGDQLQVSIDTRLARKDVQVRATPTPLSQRTRRFLQPLVGIDPESVHVHRDLRAERLADAYQADAVTIGDEVEVAAGHQDETPETLGLLAHEFTHVARQREPRFIPTVARSMGSRLSTSSLASSIDEEALALQVEGQVRQMAQRQVEQLTPFSDLAVSLSGPLAAATSPVTGTTAAGDTWGGLPVPWEPLPDWLVSSTVMGKSSAPVAPSTFQPSQAAYEPGGAERASENYGGGEIGTDSIPGVQRAGSERSLNMEETEAATSQPSPDTAKTPEPDLDALARQVYTLLKRRLGVEYRRES